MYNIIQLNDKELSELQSIASELGIKKPESYKKDDLVYKILDEQAIAGATKAVSEKKEGQKKQRSRIAVKKSGDKVYTATNDKAVRIEENKPAKAAQEAAETAETPNAESEKKAKSRTNKPKAAKKTPKAGAEGNTQEQKEETLPLKPEGAATANDTPTIPAVITKQTTAIQKAEKTESILPEPEKAPSKENNNDFIPIADLPSEKGELPSELIGKFEATKVETPVQPAPKAQQPRNKNAKMPNNGKGNNNYNMPNNQRAANANPNAEQQERRQQEKPYDFDGIRVEKDDALGLLYGLRDDLVPVHHKFSLVQQDVRQWLVCRIRLLAVFEHIGEADALDGTIFGLNQEIIVRDGVRVRIVAFNDDALMRLPVFQLHDIN